VPGLMSRRLDEVELDCLLLDINCFRYHASAAAEPVRPGTSTTEVNSALSGLDATAAASADAEMGSCATGRARPAWPLLLISDGEPGLMGAAELTVPFALCQGGLTHRARTSWPTTRGVLRPVTYPKMGATTPSREYYDEELPDDRCFGVGPGVASGLINAAMSWRNVAKDAGLLMCQVRPWVFSSNHRNPRSP
jgi:hypothetical protein